MPLGREDRMLNCDEHQLVLICLLNIKIQLSYIGEGRYMQVVTPILLPGTLLFGAVQNMSVQGGSWVEAQAGKKRPVGSGHHTAANLRGSPNGMLLHTSCGLRGGGRLIWHWSKTWCALSPGSRVTVLSRVLLSQLSIYRFVFFFHVAPISPWTSTVWSTLFLFTFSYDYKWFAWEFLLLCCSPNYQILNKSKRTSAILSDVFFQEELGLRCL